MAQVFLFLLFFIPFLVEGLGFGHEYILYYYFLIPFILYLYTVFKKNVILFPRTISIVFFLFLFFSLISSLFFSGDKQVSFEYVLFYTASYLIFVFFYNIRQEEKRLFFKQIFIVVILFTIISLIINLSKNIIGETIIPSNGYQFTTSYVGSHNHLGDLVGLVIILSLGLFYFKSQLRFLFLSFIFLPFFLLSFSRSAYLDLLITLFIALLYVKNKISPKQFNRILVLFLGLSLLIMTSFFLTVKETQNNQTFKPLYKTLNQIFSLKPKNFFSQRPEYFYQGLQSFYERPFFGVGAGNFGFSSRHYASNPYLQTETAHNVFLNVLTENGLFAFLFFFAFIYLLIRSGYKNKSIYFYLFFYIFANFQTDYTYKIFSFFILFMILGALIYEEDRQFKIPVIYGFSSLVLFLAFEIILTSAVLLKAGYSDYALKAYPLNKVAYPVLIKNFQVANNSIQILKQARIYEQVAPYNLDTLSFIANLSEKNNNRTEALRIYKKMLELNPSNNIYLHEKIETISKQLQIKH